MQAMNKNRPLLLKKSKTYLVSIMKTMKRVDLSEVEKENTKTNREKREKRDATIMKNTLTYQETLYPQKHFCYEKVDINKRRKLFNQFWSIGNYSGRCAMINMCLKKFPKKRCYTKNENSIRQYTRKYFIEEQEICKVAF